MQQRAERSTSSHRGHRWLTLTALLAVSTFYTFGQNTSSGSISGTITDGAGAVMSHAQIIITNQATGLSRTVTSSDGGYYSAESLPGGDYTLIISNPGFKKIVVKDFHLDPGVRRGADEVLSLGEVTSEVTVEASTIGVQTESSESGGTISSKQVSQLMLNGRNFQTLATIVPGVTAVSGANQLGEGGATGTVQLSVGGTSIEQTVYTIDGVYDSVPSGLITLAVTPTLDSIAEFRILKNNYGAKYGYAGSGQVLVETKSGSRTFHGTGYDYLRNNDLGTAKNFFFKPGTPYGLHQNIFGYSLGGPVMIPHLYNSNRDKGTFFFAGGEWRRTASSQFLTRAFFPQNMRNGDFSASKSLPAAGQLKPLDATSTALLTGRGLNPANCLSTDSNGKLTQINQTCMDPLSVALMNAYFPLPNAVVPGQFNNYVNTKAQRVQQSDVIYRLDHSINDKNQLMARVMYEEVNVIKAARNYNDPAPDPGAAVYSTGLNALVRWTSSFTPHITNSVQIAESFAKTASTLTGRYTIPAGVTIPRPLGNEPLNRIPSIQIDGGWSWLGVGAYPTYSKDGLGIIGDDLSWLKGNHVLQAGGVYMIGIRRANVATGNVPQGNNVFTGVHTGDPAADFLLGVNTSFVQIDSQRSGVFHYRWFESYLQDDWKATPRLSINAGVRWTYYGPTTRDGNTLANFSPSTFDPTQAPVVSTAGGLAVNSSNQAITSTGTLANATNGLVIAGQNGVPNGIVIPRKGYFAPRLGFAYLLTSDGKTSIHGGYGIGYTQAALQNTVILLPNPPFTKNITIFNSLMSNPAAGTAGAPSVQSLQAINQDFRAGMIQTFSLSVEREVIPHAVMTLAYAGNVQQHILSTQLDANFPASQTTPGTTACAAAAANTTIAPSASYQFDPCLNTAATVKSYYRPYKGYDQILSTMSGGSGSYHSGQAGLVYRAKNLTFNLAYTFSRSLTNVVPANPGSNGGGGVGYNSNATFQNPRNLRAEYGRPDFDRSHVFTVAPVWDLPYFKNSNHFLERQLLSRWSLSGLAVIESGFALTPSITLGDRGLAIRPNQIGTIKTQGSGKISAGESNYFVNAAATFQKPAYGFFGNAANGTIIGPKEVAVNVAIAKTMAMTERVGAKLTVEAFNVMNHPNISGISTTYGSGNFGQAISAGDQRIMEAALRISF